MTNNIKSRKVHYFGSAEGQEVLAFTYYSTRGNMRTQNKPVAKSERAIPIKRHGILRWRPERTAQSREHFSNLSEFREEDANVYGETGRVLCRIKPLSYQTVERIARFRVSNYTDDSIRNGFRRMYTVAADEFSRCPSVKTFRIYRVHGRGGNSWKPLFRTRTIPNGNFVLFIIIFL